MDFLISPVTKDYKRFRRRRCWRVLSLVMSSNRWRIHSKYAPPSFATKVPHWWLKLRSFHCIYLRSGWCKKIVLIPQYGSKSHRSAYTFRSMLPTFTCNARAPIQQNVKSRNNKILLKKKPLVSQVSIRGSIKEVVGEVKILEQRRLRSSMDGCPTFLPMCSAEWRRT